MGLVLGLFGLGCIAVLFIAYLSGKRGEAKAELESRDIVLESLKQAKEVEDKAGTVVTSQKRKTMKSKFSR